MLAGTVIRTGTIDHGLTKVTIVDQTETPLEGVQVSAGGSTIGSTDRNGMIFLRAAETGKTSVTLSKPGFADKEAFFTFKKGMFSNQNVTLAPRTGGVFRGRVITIDPESWDERFSPEQGLEPEAVEKNIAVARHVQALLEKAGAHTVLTRQCLKEAPTLGDRLRAGEQAQGEYFVTITHRAAKPSVSHYYNSTIGKKLAQHLATAIEKTCNVKKVGVFDAADFTIIHPSCPSVVVNFGSHNKSQKGDTAARKAQAVYEGLAGFLYSVENGNN